MKPFYTVLLCAMTFIATQTTQADTYDEYSQKVTQEIWAWDRPEFKNYKVDEQYKNESAVILAWHDQMIASARSQFRINIGLWVTINRELLYESTTRKMIKINDKVALEKYSYISYKEESKTFGYMIRNRYKTIVGARIIKPDGTIKEVDLKEAISVTEGKEEKEAYKKLAISDLQVGDIIDYFVVSEGRVDSENIPSLDFIFADEHPMLSYSIYCRLGQKLTVEYRSLNNAPEFKESTNEDDDVILEAQQTNIPKTNIPNKWHSSLRDLPIIRLAILNNKSEFIYKPVTSRKKGVYKNVDPAQILEDSKAWISDVYASHFNTLGDIKKKINTYKESHKEATQEELANYIYAAIRYHFNYQYREVDFINLLNVFFDQYKIPYQMGFTTSKYGASMNTLFTRFDVHFFTIANENQLFTYDSDFFSLTSETEPALQGESAILLSNPKKGKRKLKGTESNYQLPETTADQNRNSTLLNISFAAENPLLLNMDQKQTCTGSLKSSTQRRFYTFEKWDEEAREQLGITQSYIDELQEKRSSRKYIDDHKEWMEKTRKEFKDRFVEDIKSNLELEPTNVSAYSITHLGVTQNNPDFQLAVSYSIEGLVKKAGSNYILNVGKLIGSQWHPTEEERNRVSDAYLPTVRMYENELRIQLMPGYEVEGVDKLNHFMENEYGLFSSIATLEGDQLILKVRKVYKKSFIPALQWGKLMDMLDATNEFYGQSIALRAKITLVP